MHSVNFSLNGLNRNSGEKLTGTQRLCDERLKKLMRVSSASIKRDVIIGVFQSLYIINQSEKNFSCCNSLTAKDFYNRQSVKVDSMRQTVQPCG